MTAEALADLHAACFPLRPWSAGELEALCAEEGAVLERVAQGFALARVTLDEAELLSIAVAPEAQGRGIGRALLGALVTRLAARHVTQLFLEVAEDNAPARALYAQAGFEEVGRRRGYYTRPQAAAVDALVLRRKLRAKSV
ncbi:ribosomal protein S18-alanine N-acetyltransferase [uncultured Lentibacter sp.]|uniref:ribosomal protein S18-alanine N-acetyltransferase n=1 Tax=uncultured Lentibacter sp. TaxID=1659309 RepID=UPI0026138FD4|nr:ribosomal protein S18-alanine N-acetyltransferase [uncultured Lentibacter sp.]MCW1954750.1 ribosomal protein S18-alanine N-acetyltransferase [Roseobacter sp.]